MTVSAHHSAHQGRLPGSARLRAFRGLIPVSAAVEPLPSRHAVLALESVHWTHEEVMSAMHTIEATSASLAVVESTLSATIVTTQERATEATDSAESATVLTLTIEGE